MRTQVIMACCLFSLAACAFAANPTRRLHPEDADALKAALMQVSCRILNAQDFPDNPHYAFEISAGVPKGKDSLDAYLRVENDKGLLVGAPWTSSEGKPPA